MTRRRRSNRFEAPFFTATVAKRGLFEVKDPNGALKFAIRLEPGQVIHASLSIIEGTEEDWHKVGLSTPKGKHKP